MITGNEQLSKWISCGTSLIVQWLRLHAPTAGDTGSIPGQGTKILHYMQCGQKKKKKDKNDQLKPPHLLLWRLQCVSKMFAGPLGAPVLVTPGSKRQLVLNLFYFCHCLQRNLTLPLMYTHTHTPHSCRAFCGSNSLYWKSRMTEGRLTSQALKPKEKKKHLKFTYEISFIVNERSCFLHQRFLTGHTTKIPGVSSTCTLLCSFCPSSLPTLSY